MNQDSAFTIGRTHKVCEDYAKAGVVKDKPYVLLADGCSSATDTDFGARLLVKAAEKWIYHPFENEDGIGKAAIIIEAETYRNALKLGDDSLCATLLAAKIDGLFFNVHVFGDGMIAMRNRENGSFKVTKWDFSSGAPYYLCYELAEQRNDYFKNFPNTKYKITYYSISADFSEIETSVQEGDFYTYLNERGPGFHQSYHIGEYDLVAIMSDGISSFSQVVKTDTGITNKTVPEWCILKELLAFKNYNGNFVQRRFNRAFEKFAKDGWRNNDDVSLGVIYLP